jgi:cell division protein FtsB
LFSHRLLLLDRAGAIRLTRGKTNHQYLREVRSRAILHSLLSETVQLFEQSFFGRYALDAARFDEVRATQEQFMQALRQTREAA